MLSPSSGMASKKIHSKGIFLLAIYFIFVSYALFQVYRHNMQPDGTSYISLAQKYFNGDFNNAVNGHWSPMISWFIALFMLLGLEPMISYGIVSTLIGLVALIGIDKLMTEIEISRYTRWLYLAALAPVIAWYSQSDVGADMLCACVLLHYLHALLRNEYQIEKCAGISCGALGALSYLAKSYNFYFFLLHFAYMNISYWTRAIEPSRRKTVIFNFSSGIFAFLLISGIWIGLISTKYHTLTVSTAGTYNFSHIRPGHPTDSHPVLTDGLIPPPNSSAISAWEDPYYLKLIHWNPLQSTEDFRYYVKQILPRNIDKYLRGLAANYILDVTIIAFAAIGVIGALRKRINRKIHYLLITLLIYPLGYFALYYDGQRYVLIIPILLYILNAYLLDIIFSRIGHIRSGRILLSALLCASLLALTLMRIKRDYGLYLHEANDIYRLSATLKNQYNVRDAAMASQGGNWYQSLYLAYFLNARYFGKVRDDITDEELRRDLTHYGIKYYLVYGNLRNPLEILIPGKRVISPDGEMTVYRVREDAARSGKTKEFAVH